jgi:hypothetical protein
VFASNISRLPIINLISASIHFLPHAPIWNFPYNSPKDTLFQAPTVVLTTFFRCRNILLLSYVNPQYYIVIMEYKYAKCTVLRSYSLSVSKRDLFAKHVALSFGIINSISLKGLYLPYIEITTAYLHISH